MKQWIRAHPVLAFAGVIGAIGVALIVLVWFQPQGLLFDQRVDEELPAGLDPATTVSTTTPVATTVPPTTEVPSDTAAQTPTTTTTTVPTTTVPTTTTTAAPAGPVVLSDTELVDVGRAGSGRVLIIELEDGSRVVRLEDLDVVNGPDLVVILSPSPLVDDRELYDDGEFISIGDLKGNQGNQNYDIPPDVNLEDFGTVAIWCRRFNYTFNAAPIELAPI